MIQRNAVVMRVVKSKWEGRLRAADLRLVSWDSRCFMMAAQGADLQVASHGKRPTGPADDSSNMQNFFDVHEFLSE